MSKICSAELHDGQNFAREHVGNCPDRQHRQRAAYDPARVTTRPAFTLVELMVVLVILGLLASVVTVSVRDYLVTGKQTTARTEIAQIANALELFHIESDRFPSNDEGLALLTRSTARHPQGILQGDLLDPWGHDYVYVYPGLHGTYDVISYGADGQEGGEGADLDLVSWQLGAAKAAQ